MNTLALTLMFYRVLFFLIYLFWLRWVFVAVCRLPLVAEWELLLVVVRGLLGVASHGWLLLLWSPGSRVRGLHSHGSQSSDVVVTVYELSCFPARGIFPDQGSNLCALHWQADSHPLRHQEVPILQY